MSASTRFLLLVIIGIAIALLGSHFLTIVLAIALMLLTYAMPLLIVLGLLYAAWRLVLGESKKEEPKPLASAKSANPKTNSTIPSKTEVDMEIERELNRLKHRMGQHNKKP